MRGSSTKGETKGEASVSRTQGIRAMRDLLGWGGVGIFADMYVCVCIYIYIHMHMRDIDLKTACARYLQAASVPAVAACIVYMTRLKRSFDVHIEAQKPFRC